MKEKLNNVITDRLLRMGLIGQPVKNHSHAIDLLVEDVTATLQQEIENMKYELDENNPQYPVRLTYNQALDAVLTLLKDIQ